MLFVERASCISNSYGATDAVHAALSSVCRVRWFLGLSQAQELAAAGVTTLCKPC